MRSLASCRTESVSSKLAYVSPLIRRQSAIEPAGTLSLVNNARGGFDVRLEKEAFKTLARGQTTKPIIFWEIGKLRDRGSAWAVEKSFPRNSAELR